ncbi:MAG: restriction endonuclease subunit S [Chromatiaceae bacterium]|nr:restriction endonuclease subunit S [Chromatiaceae bacterium]
MGAEIPKGYKLTEVGVIPEDWEVKSAHELAALRTGPFGTLLKASEYSETDGVPVISVSEIRKGFLRITENTPRVSDAVIRRLPQYLVRKGDIVFGRKGGVDRSALIREPQDGWFLGSDAMSLRPSATSHDAYLALQFQSGRVQGWLLQHAIGTTMPSLNQSVLRNVAVPLPPTKAEQEAIAEALSDADAFIESLDQLLAKKRQLKQGAMQELLTGKKRLPGFSGEWEVKLLEEVADCLDNLRVPLNESQRDQMRGDYPYCGANGVLDFVNDYVIDDDVILIAEDGGYFDEYSYRPIAYRMVGKCWVNNHAHILKAKLGHDQVFIFFSLVHKNILGFLASGTRAKLNKSEMWKIEVDMPVDFAEQTAIATILSDMDAEIAALEAKLAKARSLKQGMMQELLTGRIRLV